MDEVTVNSAGGEDSERIISWSEFIHDSAVECIRHGITLSEFWSLTPKEYGWLREGWELSALDEDYKTAQNAWLNARARDRRQTGNRTVLVHTDFDEFFPYEKKLKTLKNRQDVRAGRKLPGDEKLRKLSQYISQQNKERNIENQDRKEVENDG